MITQVTLNELPKLTIAYSGSTVILGFDESDNMLVVNMSSAAALNLLMELREALHDLHTDPGETDQ